MKLKSLISVVEVLSLPIEVEIGSSSLSPHDSSLSETVSVSTATVVIGRAGIGRWHSFFSNILKAIQWQEEISFIHKKMDECERD